MATITARRSRTAKYAVNPNTFEVFEAVESANWTDKLTAWQTAIRAIRSAGSSKNAALPSPMPAGHVMFERKPTNFYRPCDELPKPIWTDGLASLYAGQRVSWQQLDKQWAYGEVLGIEENGTILIRRSHGGVCTLPAESI